MSATGCVIGAIGFGFHSQIELASNQQHPYTGFI